MIPAEHIAPMTETASDAWDNISTKIFTERTYLIADEYYMLRSMFHLARTVHDGQMRSSGDPYFEGHVVPVVELLFECDITDPETITGALGHDVFEEWQEMKQAPTQRYSDYKLQLHELISASYDGSMADILVPLTKPEIDDEEVRNERERIEAHVRELEAAPSKALLIKMADRANNLETLSGLSRKKQDEQLLETAEYMLGLFEGLENIYPKAYAILAEKIYRVLNARNPNWRQSFNSLLALRDVKENPFSVNFANSSVKQE